ncbi:RDD family protein [Chryseobacterium sp. 3008163]|uniref:RDD family protein n=1 Tax=Chryseobacterium sp. 3008163 TaxID=2478663 RepID=UPI0013EDAEFF|nr:RDD family protein [Chryseobacterium sp. 3008163]
MKKEKFLSRRIIAGLIDYTVIFFVTFTYIKYFGEVNSEGEFYVSGVKALPVFIFWFVYNCVIEVYLQSTFGNYLVKLKPVDEKTELDITIKQSFLRHIVDPIDMFFFGLVAIIIITNSQESKRLGDLLAKTKVVKI